MQKKGFTLVEALTAVTCLGLLAGMVAPSLSAARQMARRAACASQMHHIGTALATYAAVHRFVMPPFQFYDGEGNLPASGHWGGPSQPNPITFAPPRPINLWCLVAEDMLPGSALVCPAAAGELRDGCGSLFTHTSQFSTYCLRFPPSRDLFRQAPGLAYRGGGGLLAVYVGYAGGDSVNVSSSSSSGASGQIVPLVKLNRRYELLEEVRFTSTTFDPASDVILSDGFWWRQHHEPPPQAQPGGTTYPIYAGWSHDEWFNVLSGSGAVRTLRDDGTIAANCIPPGGSCLDDGIYFGEYAERIWQWFDAAR